MKKKVKKSGKNEQKAKKRLIFLCKFIFFVFYFFNNDEYPVPKAQIKKPLSLSNPALPAAVRLSFQMQRVVSPKSILEAEFATLFTFVFLLLMFSMPLCELYGKNFPKKVFTFCPQGL